MKFLRFTLAASLQSWGEDSPWEVRQTSEMPTKSGVVGLISACFGYRHGDPRIAELNNSIRVAFRADKPGTVMIDFNAIKSNRDYMVSSEGKMRLNGGQRITGLISRKYYLQDARFQVFIQAEENVLNAIYTAMRSPKWLVSLGRKACVPSEPVIPVWIKADNLYDAVRQFEPVDREKAEKRVKVEMDYSGTDKSTLIRKVYTRQDNSIGGAGRNCMARKVCSFYVDV